MHDFYKTENPCSTLIEMEIEGGAWNSGARRRECEERSR